MGLIEEKWAERTTRWFSGSGSSVARVEAKACVTQLRKQAERAPEIIADITGLKEQAEAVSSFPVYVVDRSGWAHVTARNISDTVEKGDSLHHLRSLWISSDHFALAQSSENPCVKYAHENDGFSLRDEEIARRIKCASTGKFSESHGADRGAQLRELAASPGIGPASCTVPSFLVQSMRSACEAFSSFADSIQISMGLATLAPRVLGQFDPLWKHGEPLQKYGRILLVAPNVWALGAGSHLDRRDLALAVAVHEFVHAVQYEAAPWLRDYMLSRIKATLTWGEEGVSEEERIGMAREIIALTSLLDGHAAEVVASVPRVFMPSRDHLVKVMARGASPHLFMELLDFLGLTHKAERYKLGEEFVRAVVAAHGHEGFNRVWETPHNLPTLEELAHPDMWMRRVL